MSIVEAMLPLITLLPFGADADELEKPTLPNRLIEELKQNELQKRPKLVSENGELPRDAPLSPLPPKKNSQAAMMAEMQRTADRLKKQREARELKEQNGKLEQEKKNAVESAQREIDRAVESLKIKTASDTETDEPISETDPSGDDDQRSVISFGVDEEDNGLDELDRLFDEFEEASSMNDSRSDYLTVGQIDSIYASMENTLTKINKLVSNMDTNANDNLMKIADRIKSDMRMILALRMALATNQTFRELNDLEFRRDLQRVSDIVAESVAQSDDVAESVAEDGSESVESEDILLRLTTVILPLVGMFIVVLAGALFAGKSMPLPVVSNDDLSSFNPYTIRSLELAKAHTVDTFVIVPSQTSTTRKKYRRRFHTVVSACNTTRRVL